MYSNAGKILWVNLSTRKICFESTSNYMDKFLGGRGINQWILFRETSPDIYAFDPACPIIFGTGVLVGTLAPGACRYNVDSRNCMTGGIGSGNSGGHFGPELKFAGYDNIVIIGRRREPCYLWINDSNIEIRKASHLWGKTTWENDDMIREELGDDDIQLATIGPAGENLVRGACIINNGARAVGRCGLGAVMGSKHLKAVAVKGTGGISIAKPKKFMKLVEELWEKIQNNSETKLLKKYGTTFIPEENNKVSANPVRNFQDGYWEKAENLSAEELDKKYTVRRVACFSCPIPGSHWLRISDGEFEGVEGEGFEANTIKDFGYKLDIDYWPAIIKAHILCSQYGLDVDNTAGPIAWAMECYQRGILKKEDLDGLELEWGNYKAVLELIRKIAMREGVGDLLAEGSKRASDKVGKGSQKYAMHIKGQDLYEPLRSAKGWGIGVILSPRGGGHMRGAPAFEFYGKVNQEEGEKYYGVRTAGDRKTYEGKAKLITFMENFKAVVDSMGICYLLTCWRSPYLIGPGDLASLFEAATGKSLSGSELMKIGERIHNIEKAFNVRVGMTRKDDKPPERFFQPIKSGPAKGERLEKEKFKKVLDEYYELRGWDKETGLPTRVKLQEVGLKEVADNLEKYDKLK